MVTRIVADHILDITTSKPEAQRAQNKKRRKAPKAKETVNINRLALILNKMKTTINDQKEASSPNNMLAFTTMAIAPPHHPS